MWVLCVGGRCMSNHIIYCQKTVLMCEVGKGQLIYIGKHMIPRITSIYWHNVGVCDLVHVQFTHEIVLYVLYVKALSTKNKPFHPWVKWLWQSNKATIKNTKRNQIMSSTMECNSVFYLPLFLCHQTTWKGKGVCGGEGVRGGKRPPFPYSEDLMCLGH